MGCATSRTAASRQPILSSHQTRQCDDGFYLYRAEEEEGNLRRQIGSATWGDARMSRVPRDVTSVRVDSSVKSIAASAFFGCYKLEKVELCDGLDMIGESAFWNCESLRTIKIPASVTVIWYGAFYNCTSLKSVNILSTVRVNITREAFQGCRQLISVEFSNEIGRIGSTAFQNCSSLRNVLIPNGVSESQNCSSPRNVLIPNGVSESESAFLGCHDLLQLFGSQHNILNALTSRFEGLPIHKLCYHQSQYPTKVNINQFQSIVGTNPGRREVSLMSNSMDTIQDCIGMTALHILVCSAKPNLALVQLIVDENPNCLVTKDKWGCIPLIYAIWGNAPHDIVHFLVKSHKSPFLRAALDWDIMVQTLCRAGESLHVIERLLSTRQKSFTKEGINWLRAARELTICCLVKCESFRDFSSIWDATIQAFIASTGNNHVLAQHLLGIQTRFFLNKCEVDWQAVCEELVKPVSQWWKPEYPEASLKTFQFLVKSNLPERLEAIGPIWRRRVKQMVQRIPSSKNAQGVYDFDKTHSKLVSCEREYHQTKNAMALLELALWQSKIKESMQLQCNTTYQIGQIGFFSTDMKRQCHVCCGVDIVIPNVLPFLVGE